jgi:hypothetical protein
MRTGFSLLGGPVVLDMIGAYLARNKSRESGGGDCDAVVGFKAKDALRSFRTRTISGNSGVSVCFPNDSSTGTCSRLTLVLPLAVVAAVGPLRPS